MTSHIDMSTELLSGDERIVAIEDTLEHQFSRLNSLRLEARELERYRATMRDILRHSLQHPPDDVCGNEVRRLELADLLQGPVHGHGGSLNTVQANNATSRCGARQAGELPWEVVSRSLVDGIVPCRAGNSPREPWAGRGGARVEGWIVGDSAWYTRAVEVARSARHPVRQ